MINKRVISVKYLTKLLRRDFISGLYEHPYAVFEIKIPDRVTVIFDDSGFPHYLFANILRYLQERPRVNGTVSQALYC